MTQTLAQMMNDINSFSDAVDTITDKPHFKVVVADPPWWESGGGGRGAQNHYPLMKTPAIIELMTTCEPMQRTTDDALMFMWVTNNFLKDGLAVMDACDFEYMTMLTWVKDRFGLGYYFRGQTEHVLFGRRGKQPRPQGTFSTWLGGKVLPKRKHSQKPPELQDMIEARWDGPYLEMFAREARDGWDVFGNEVG